MLICYVKFRVCNILLKNSKFNWATSIQFLKCLLLVIVLSDYLEINLHPDF